MHPAPIPASAVILNEVKDPRLSVIKEQATFKERTRTGHGWWVGVLIPIHQSILLY
jgi:hypothetical protein